MVEHATRIISLLPSATEILCGLGLQDQLVGISHECDYPSEILGLPRVTISHIRSEMSPEEIDSQVRERLSRGESLYELNVPLLIELQPEWIITQAQCDVCAIRQADVLDMVKSYSELHRTQVVSLQPKTLKEMLDDILQLGRSLARKEQAFQWQRELERRIDVVSRQCQYLQNGGREKIVCLEWTDPLMASGNWIPEMIELVGGGQPFCLPGDYSRAIVWEELSSWDPDCVIIMPCGFSLERAEEEARRMTRFSGWQNLTAVRRGAVFAVDGNAYFNRSGPRLVESLEILAFLSQPELCEEGRAITLPEKSWKKIIY